MMEARKDRTKIGGTPATENRAKVEILRWWNGKDEWEIMPGDSPLMPGDGPIMPGDGPIMPGDGPLMPGDGPLIN